MFNQPQHPPSVDADEHIKNLEDKVERLKAENRDLRDIIFSTINNLPGSSKRIRDKLIRSLRAIDEDSKE